MEDEKKVNNNITDLHPSIAPLAMEYVKLMIVRKIPAYIFETRRSPARQKYLHAQGYSQIKSGGVHEFGIAFDVVFQGAKPWDDSHPWNLLGQIGKDLGLYWGGTWKGFVDSPHFQYVPASALAQGQLIKGNFPPPPLPTLTRGDYGDTVALLQRLLQVTPDGDYGAKTTTAVMAVQKRAGLTPDGVCRWGTWKNIISN